MLRTNKRTKGQTDNRTGKNYMPAIYQCGGINSIDKGQPVQTVQPRLGEDYGKTSIVRSTRDWDFFIATIPSTNNK